MSTGCRSGDGVELVLEGIGVESSNRRGCCGNGDGEGDGEVIAELVTSNRFCGWPS